MNGDENRDPTSTPGAAPEKQSIEDLKAKLGLKMRPKAAEAAPQPAEEARPAAPASASPMRRPTEPMHFEDLPVQKGLDKKVLWGGIALAVVVAILGMFLGGIMRSRSIENLKTKEAQHLLEYFGEARTSQLGAGAEPVLEVVDAHIADTLRLVEMMTKGADARATEAELKAFLKRAQAYRDRKALFAFEQVFPGVIFNGEIAAQVVGYVQGVQRLYDETVLLALEADTLDRVTELDDKGKAFGTVYLQPAEKDASERQAIWISRIDKESGKDGPGGTLYPALPLTETGAEADKGMMVLGANLAQVDLGPIAVNKSMRYKVAIFDRVRARLGSMKMIAEQINFAPLKEKLQKYASRGSYFTMF
jgi:hypothetical protein